jgi:hypothetical protein
MAAIGTEKLDLFVAKLLPVTVKLALALRAGHPKNLRHGTLTVNTRFTTEAQSSQRTFLIVSKQRFFAPRPPPLRGEFFDARLGGGV